MAVSITATNFEEEIKNSAKPVVVKVYAEWCGPCQQMVPTFAEIEQEFGETYKFAKLNVDEARDISIQYGVTSVPTFIFIQGGEVKGKESGYMSKEDLQEKIKKHLG